MATEKRLINVVDATKVYNGIALYMAENAYLNDTALDVLKMVANWLNEAPTVDAVEVVRCGECRFVDTDACPMSGTPGRVSASDFCSYGERRTND